jgi:hypothetical protein
MPRQSILAENMQVGDIYIELGSDKAYEWSVTSVVIDNCNKIRLRCKWTGKGPDPKEPNDCYTFYMPRDRTILRYIERKCKPCYDSDCDCIYDNITGE